MVTCEVIKNLKEVLDTKVLKPSENIVNTEISPLTAPGENYGSIMLSIRAKIKDTETDNERFLDMVAKLVPTSEAVWKVFSIAETFRIEVKYYSEIVPALDNILKNKGFEEGADFAAPYFGGRLNLNNTQTVDTDAVLLLQNLKKAGYKTGIKKTGLDEESFKVTLDSLAKFHAAGLALKTRDFKTFEEKVRPCFFHFQPQDEIFNMALKNLVHTLEISGFKEEEIEKAKTAYLADTKKNDISDNWGTLSHYDTWTNNILIKHEDSKPVHSVLIDFQIFNYGTPLNDLTFFIFGSLQQHVLDTKLEEILDYYYQKFLNNLKRLDLDTKEYPRENFDEEIIKAVSKYEYMHAMWMLTFLMYPKLHSIDAVHSDMADSFADYDEDLVKRIGTITRICLNKGWI